MMKSNTKKDTMLEIKLVKSRFGRIPPHCATIESLGLKKINQTVIIKSTPAVLGMIKKVNYLLEVKEK